jgi:LmbE family N-acetylglucosaminyl deacetylase
MFRSAALAGIVLLVCAPAFSAEVTLEGGPTESGFNSGTFAYIHATLHGINGDPKRYEVSAEIQYFGTTANASVEMDPVPQTKPGAAEYQGGWPIPFQAPTGFYTVTLHVDDRVEHLPGVMKKVRGFVVYKKSIRISRINLDKAVYNVGDPIRCGVAVENLSDTEVKGLHVEFSNAIYPWISTVAQGGRANPELETSTLRDNLDIPAASALGVPMSAVRSAAFPPKIPDADEAAAIPAENGKPRSSETTQYAVTVWSADRTVLYDMQFTPEVVIRTLSSETPKAYNGTFAHAYLESLNFTNYRAFYSPAEVSEEIEADATRTLHQPGETVKLAATLKNSSEASWSGASLQARIADTGGKEVFSGTLLAGIHLAPRGSMKVSADAWKIPSQQSAGTYPVELSLTGSDGKLLGRVETEIAVNALPASVLVVCPHEGDEQAYAGLIRAAIESGISVEVLVLTAGDVSHCARYFSKACGPNESWEFGNVRMEESRAALEHLGLAPNSLSFMALPENGLSAIWFDHKDSAHPFLSLSLACDHAPYGGIYKPNLAYARDAVIAAIRQVLTDFHPAMIVTTPPDAENPDHRAANWLVLEACHELLKTKEIDPQTIILTNPARAAAAAQAAPFKTQAEVFYLSGEAAALKQEMSWIYQSQFGNQAEVAARPLRELQRTESYLRILDWQEHAGWNEENRN